MIHTFYKKSADRFFYWWLEQDLNKFLQLIEKKSLQKTGEQRAPALLTEKNSLVGEWARNLWDYGAHFLLHTYKEGQSPVVKQTIQEQAETVTADLIAVYTEGKKEKSNRPLAAFFPAPPVIFEKWKKDMYKEAEDGQGDLDAVLRSFLQFTNRFSLEQTMELIKREKAFHVMIQALLHEYFSFIPQKPFRPKEKHYVMLVWRLLYQAARDIQRFSAKHGLRFSHDGEIRCFYNMLNLYLHHFAVHGKTPTWRRERELYFAASALHPLQDDYIDEANPSKATIAAIGEKVAGKQGMHHDGKARGILDLIEVIYRVYPVKENPLLVSIFSKLHEYQCLSAEQKSKQLDEKKLLHISFMKGGYAFAFFGCMVQGKMSVAQFNHYFIMGAIFQLLDDFHDIKDDLKSGSATVWTRAIERGEQLDSVLNAVIGLQYYYEEKTSLVTDFNHPVFMRRIELFGIRYDAFRFFTMNEEYFSEEYVREFENCFPYSLELPKRIYNSSRPYERIGTLLAVLEEWRTFLNSKA